MTSETKPIAPKAQFLPQRDHDPFSGALLGGSWVVISGVISRVTTIITHVRGLITLLIATHEPPSR